ncbi:hypothetical protein WG622_01870 [Cognatishimia sp. D5M38]|uniref:Uncharacterized protein n=1 Tax=Cognatishimia coralii TaxID=3083254 RepID=A0ABU8QC56_9RHOB
MMVDDPRGLILESYRIEGITEGQCRSIFLDWALGIQLGEDMVAKIQSLLDHYGPDNPDHPMTGVLREGLAKGQEPKRRGGRSARVPS